jgi:hypothetical protein
MAFDFVEDTSSKVDGLTLHSKGYGRATAVYLPRRELLAASSLDVMIWLHGYYVDQMPDILKEYAVNNPDGNGDPRLKQSVKATGKDLVIVAPFLGKVPYGPSKKERDEAVTDPKKAEVVKAKLAAKKAAADRYATVEADLGKGTAGFDFLNDVLDALAAHHAKARATGTTGTTSGAPKPARPKLGKLYIACHSGGGDGMLALVGSLGGYKPNLKECWGFDCIYSAFYDSTARAQPDIKFYLYFGRGSDFSLTYDLYLKKYGQFYSDKRPAPGLDRLFLAPATGSQVMGADDDTRAFVPTSTILQWRFPPLYEAFRRQLDLELGDKNKWMQFLNLQSAKLRGHFDVPASLLEPRILQSMARP